MAVFSTVKGSGAAATTIAGTSGVDFASITTLDNYFLGAQQGADTIGLTANISDGTLKGGQGTDTLSFTAGASISDSHVNTNSNNDTIGVNAAGTRANLFTTTLLGGQGDDTLALGTVSGGRANGNKNADTVTVQSALNTTIFGGQGVDGITLNAGTHTGSLVSGDLDSDTLTLTAASTLTNITLSGGQGNDSINGNAAMTAATGTQALGGDGIDTINFAAFTQAVSINGGADGDIINSGTAADTVLGETGNDSITNNGGNDTITGGAGADYITANGNATGERFVQNTGSSVAATVGWTNAADGTLTDDNSAITFGNGVDVIAGALTDVTDQIQMGIASATLISAANGFNIGNAAAGNYYIIGDWTPGTNVFNADDNGPDTLILQVAGGDLRTAANNGTTALVLDGTALDDGDNIIA